MNTGTLANDNEDESSTNANMSNRTKALLNSSKSSLFMKYNPIIPKLGFTQQIVELPKSNNDNAFSMLNALSDHETHQGLKTHSDWHARPQ